MADYSAVGTCIHAMRMKKNLTQEQLGELVGVGTTHISHIETGTAFPSFQTFVKLVNVLECSADDLLKQTEKVENSES